MHSGQVSTPLLFYMTRSYTFLIENFEDKEKEQEDHIYLNITIQEVNNYAYFVILFFSCSCV